MKTIIELLKKSRDLDCYVTISQRELGLKIVLRKTLKNGDTLMDEMHILDMWSDAEKESTVGNLFARFSEHELHYNQSSGQ